MRGQNQTLCRKTPPAPAAKGSAAFDSAPAFKLCLAEPLQPARNRYGEEQADLGGMWRRQHASKGKNMSVLSERK